MITKRPLSSLLYACVLALAPLLPAQETAARQAPEQRPLRVHVIGASVSGGFVDGPLFGADEKGDSISLQLILRSWADGEARVSTHNTMEMIVLFRNPVEIGERQVKRALKGRPDVVVAVDFPFWFGYGYVSGDESEARRKLMAEGLAMLAKFEVPVLIGDLPNMRGAARRMISPRQIPSPKVLDELNAQLGKFVEQHANVQLVQLSGIVREMREEGVALPLEGGPVKVPKLSLQQADRLHATRLGMAYLGYMLQPTLAAAFPEEHPLRSRKWTFEQFVEAARADEELEELLEMVAETKAGGGR